MIKPLFIINLLLLALLFMGCSALPESVDPTNTSYCNGLSYKLAHGRISYDDKDIELLEYLWNQCEKDWRGNIRRFK